MNFNFENNINLTIKLIRMDIESYNVEAYIFAEEKEANTFKYQ